MNENSPKTRQLTQILAREEKKFLMEQYASLLVQQLEGNGQEELDERTTESLLVARSYASPELADRIAALLLTKGIDVEWEDEEVDLPEEMPLMGEESAMLPVGGRMQAADTDEIDTLFEDDDTDTLSEDDEDDTDTLFEDDEDDTDTLFEDDEDDTDTLFEDDEDDTDTLFREDTGEDSSSSAVEENQISEQDEEKDPSETTVEEELSSDAFDPSDGSEPLSEEDADLPVAQEATAESVENQEDEERRSAPKAEEDEEAGVLFSEDIYSSNKGAAKSSEETIEESEKDGKSPRSQPAAKQQKKRRLKPSIARKEKREETAGFEPTQGHQQEETAGFKPSESREKNDTSGTQRTKERTKKKKEKASQKRKRERKPVHTDEQAGEKSPLQKGERSQSSRQEALERAAKVKEELERRRQAREAERLAREQESENPEEETSALLEAITYSVSLDDLERYLDIKVPPEDRLKLERRLHQKMREPSVKALLNQIRETGQAYAMIPRLPHFFKSGNQMKVTMANLLRSYPHLFENVQQVILKFRTESFFMQQTPPLDWTLVTGEVLPDSRQKSYAQQKMVLKQYAHQFQASELRVRRRNLVDALYDLIVVQMVIKENMLRETVDLTETKIGRQNLAFINYGEGGIRISDISRQDTHPQLGVCPCW